MKHPFFFPPTQKPTNHHIRPTQAAGKQKQASNHSARYYCVAVMVMSKLKVVMPLMLDETVRFSTAWTDAPTAST
jgi:hypothetical protein